MQSLPVLAQQAVGLLVLAAILGLIYWHSRPEPHLFHIFMAAGYIVFALVLAGVWPAATGPLTMVLAAAMLVSARPSTSSAALSG